MDKKPEIQNYVCVFDVDNRQNDYARCLKTIERIENRMQIQHVYDCIEWWPFYMLRGYETGTINDLRRIRELEQHLAKRNGYESNIKKADDINRVIIKNENSEICFQYYFRISLSQSEVDIIELQYFILLLQSLPKLAGRIAVSFISKRSQWTIGDYFRVSHYLFFVQKKYPIFYAAFHDGEPVQRLTKNHKGVQKNFIPVLEIDWTNLEKCPDLGN